jgi:two-component sensor histidine kinase
MHVITKTPSYLLRINQELTILESKLPFNELIGYNPTGYSLFKLLYNPQNDLKSLHDFNSDADFAEFIADFKRVDGKIISFKALVLKINESGDIVLHLRNYTNMKLMRKDIIRKTLSIEHLAKSRKIRNGEFGAAIHEILITAARALQVDRVNAWIYDENLTEIRCIGNYEARQKTEKIQAPLPKIAFPNYFSLFETTKIIVTNDALNDLKIDELKEMYLEPNNIGALMDIPIRIEGKMIGVLCIEHTNSPKNWSVQEQLFGLVIAQIISLAIETKNKLDANNTLKELNQEQSILLQEVHHRVKNNLSIVSSLLNLQSNKCKDEYHRALFNDSKNRINSIASVHEVIYKSNSFANLNLKEYFEQILSFLQQSFSNNTSIIIIPRLQLTFIEVTRAIPIALIINEIVTNCFKHAFPKQKKGVIKVQLTQIKKEITLIISDDGIGIQNIKSKSKDSIGFEILEGLVDQIDGRYYFEIDNGTTFTLKFTN